MLDKNRLSRTLDRLAWLPPILQRSALTLLFGGAVRYVRTSGIKFIELTQDHAILTIPNRRQVQNHIGTVHASAMGLLAETATGAVLAMNMPDDRVPVLKSMHVSYLHRAQGNLRAEAHLSSEVRRQILIDEKGETIVPVQVTDESGVVPLECEMLWAWRPRSRA